jgi:septal ring factor EnvC (AmiA/AmiB activator)
MITDYNPAATEQRAQLEHMIAQHRARHFELEMQIVSLRPQQGPTVKKELKELEETRDNFRRAIDALTAQLAGMPDDQPAPPQGD